MRIFHVKVFDAAVEGTDPVYSSPEFDELLASPTVYNVVAVVSQVSGTDPTLTVKRDESPDRTRWITTEGAVIDGASLSASEVTMAAGASVAPFSGFNRLAINLGGTTPRAQVAVWVTGRDTAESD